jgi:membrane-bound lytic murein transglycosylase B
MIPSTISRTKAFILAGLTLLFCYAVSISVSAQVAAVGERRAQLEKDLAELESQIDTQRAILTQKQNESVSLQRDIDILNAKIKKSELSIKARTLAINNLSEDIADKGVLINKYSATIDQERESIAELLRQTDELDSYSLAEVVLSGQNFSKFFQDIGPFVSIKEALKKSITDIASVKEKTQTERDALEEKKTEQVSLQTLQQLEKRRTEQEQVQKKQILTVSKGLESLYKKIVSSSEQNAAKIRAELFTLQGSAAIPFEKALEYAITVSKATGVRPALILGIIAEESNLGENVGKGNWRVDMKDPRDTVPFLDITRRLGLNPDQMPVSKKPWYGYGGAMGPAQFIPSTWIQFESRIAQATSHNPPNPWDPYDAFMAAGILLKDNGASKGTASAERLAALRYLAGWTNANKRAYAFYGDDVMDLASKYQVQINVLNAN